MHKLMPSETGCVYCKDNKEFVLPDHLLQRIKEHEVVLFCGAGISTENKNFCKSTFYEDVQAELGINEDLPFPELMDRYCSAPDGRIKLIQKISDRFKYFVSFSEFYWSMTRFHRTISPLYMISDIVTTNWDDFFERECGIDPIVYDPDVAFWDAVARRVVKVHGSISNFGSIVATSADYRASYRRLNSGPLGAQLKSLMSRKTIVYTGYSLSDQNYLRLLKNVSRMMGGHIRQSYFIAPRIDWDKLARAPVPLVGIETDGAHFFEHVVTQLEDEGNLIKGIAFDFCEEFLSDVVIEHSRAAEMFLRTHHPLIIFALGYQDGLIHALKRIKRQRNTGEYHCPGRVHSLVHGYQRKLGEFRRRRDYWNAAYALGYQNGLLLLLVASEDGVDSAPPLYDFPFDVSPGSLSAISRFPRKKIPKAAQAQVNRMLRQDPGLERDLIPDHTPYL